MALLFMDGFDVGDFSVKWPMQVNGNIAVPSSNVTTRFGVGRSLSTPSGSGGGYSGVKRFILPAATIYLGAAFYTSTGSSGRPMIVLSGDSGATDHLSLSFNQADGSLTLYRGNGTTLIATSASGHILASTWKFIEVSATISDTVGTCTVRVDGMTVISFTGDTRNGGTATLFDTVLLQAAIVGLNGSNYLWDDVYLCDGTGAAPYNGFLGDVRVYSLSPTGAGSSTQWTPDTGSNFSRVNEIPYSAANYVQSNTSGQRDTYAVTDLPVGGVTTIYGVQNNVIAKRTDAGAVAVKPALKSSATIAYGTSAVLPTSDTVVTDVRTTDPATSAAWTINGVNNLEVGMEVG